MFWVSSCGFDVLFGVSPFGPGLVKVPQSELKKSQVLGKVRKELSGFLEGL